MIDLVGFGDTKRMLKHSRVRNMENPVYVQYGFGHALRITGDRVRQCMHYELGILEEFPA